MRTGGMVWRALEAARAANLVDKGVASPRPAPGSITRRRLLGAMAASIALPAFARELPPTPKGGRVAIIGGGLAGLVALRDLRAAGVDARLYEARNRLGGRVSTYYGGPVPADDGGQFINGDHADMLALARQYGLGLIDRETMPGASLAIANGRVIAEAELARDLRPIAARIAADAEALDADFTKAAPPLDALSVRQYLDRHAAAMPKSYVRALMEATIRTEFGQEPEDASALELIFNLPVVKGTHVRIIGASDERYVLAGGSSTVVAALARELAAFCELSQVLTSVERAGPGVRLRFAQGATVEAERAIITVPAPLLRTIDFGDLLSPQWRAYAAEIDCGRNEKLNAAYRGRPWQGAGASMGRAGDVWPLPGGFAELWDAGTVPSDTGLLTFFMGGAQCAAAAQQPDGAALRRSFESQAAPAVPGLGAAASGWQRRTYWNNDPFSRGAYSCFRPGQLTRFAELFWVEEEGKTVQTSAAGPLIFAGEHLSDAWPGYMNGGAQTGRLAAQAVLQGVGRPLTAAG